MNAVVFHDVGDIRLEDVPEPKMQEPADAIVRITASAICGTDLHFVRGTVPGGRKTGAEWNPGDAPTQVFRWAVKALAKAGTLAIIGVYPPTHTSFPIGEAMNKNLTMKMGNCNHRKYIPELLELIANGAVHPSKILSRQEPLTAAVEAYQIFSKKDPGWMKVRLAA